MKNKAFCFTLESLFSLLQRKKKDGALSEADFFTVSNFFDFCEDDEILIRSDFVSDSDDS